MTFNATNTLTLETPDINDTFADSVRKGVTPFFILTQDECFAPWRQNKDLGALVIDKGRIRIGRFTVEKPTISNGLIQWDQLSDRGFTSGHLWVRNGGCELHGRIVLGDDQDNATDYFVVATALPLSVFRTETAQDDGRWVPGPTLTMGYDQYCASEPRLRVLIDRQDLSGESYVRLDDTSRRPALIFNMAAEDEDARLADLTFKISKRGVVSFEGTVFPLNDAQPHKWRGTSIGLVASQDIVTIDPVLPDYQAAYATPEEIRAQESRALMGLIALAPQDSKVGAETFSEMIRRMKWAMARDGSDNFSSSRRKWLLELMREKPPLFDTDQVKDLESRPEQERWYRDHMALAMISQNLVEHPIEEKLLRNQPTTQQRAKIKLYMESCLSADPGFLTARESAWPRAYLNLASRLETYIKEDQEIRKDPRGRKTWVERLYNHYTAEQKDLDKLIEKFSSNIGASQEKKEGNKYDKYEKEIKEIKAKIDKKNKKINDPKTPEDIREDYRQDVKTLESSIATINEAVASIKKTEQEEFAKQTENINSISSILYALEPSGDYAKKFALRAAAIPTMATASQVLVDRIPDFKDFLTRNIDDLLGKISRNELRAFGHQSVEKGNQGKDAKPDETLDAALCDELNRSIKENNVNTTQIAQSFAATFCSYTNTTANTALRQTFTHFDRMAPKLMPIIRICAVFAIIGVVVKLSQMISLNPKLNWDTAKEVSVMGFMAYQSFQTIGRITTSLVNTHGIKERLRIFLLGSGNPSPAAAQPGVVSKFFTQVYASLTYCFGAIATAASEAAGWVAQKLANTFLMDLITGVSATVSTAMAYISQAGTWVKTKVTTFWNWMGGKFSEPAALVGEKLSQAKALLGKLGNLALRILPVVLAIWSTYTAFDSYWHYVTGDNVAFAERMLAASYLVTNVIGTICSIASVVLAELGYLAASMMWSGVGIAVALVGFAIYLIWKHFFPEKNNIEKLFDETIYPFINGPVTEALKKLPADLLKKKGVALA